jgi:hypothetical protein
MQVEQFNPMASNCEFSPLARAVPQYGADLRESPQQTASSAAQVIVRITR